MKNSLPYKIITQVICVVLLVILVFPLYLTGCKWLWKLRKGV